MAFNVDVRDKLVVNSSPPSETKELILRVIEVRLAVQGKNCPLVNKAGRIIHVGQDIPIHVLYMYL